MSIRLLVASGNAGKLRDFRAAAEAHAIAVDPVAGLDRIPAPEETGETLEENACLKAVYYSRFAPGELVVADDSGLEVDALGGEPGVRSARYAADAGIAADPALSIDEQNNRLLLERMEGVAADRRTARYRCVLAAARDGQVELTVSGAVEGRIMTAPRGTGGFGYDPLFLLPELGQTMAEIDLARKHTLSHRGRAFGALLERLEG